MTGSKGTKIQPSEHDDNSKFALRSEQDPESSEEARKRTRGIFQPLFTHIKIKPGFPGRNQPRCSHILLQLEQKQVPTQEFIMHLLCINVHCRNSLKSQDAEAANSISCLFIIEETHSSKFCVGFSRTR